MKRGFAPCNNKGCDKKESCDRFLDEDNVQYINYKYFMRDGICNYYEEIKTEVQETKEPNEDPMEKSSDKEKESEEKVD